MDKEINEQISLLKREVDIYKKALQLAREYMFKVMCAEDVPSEEWFIQEAKKDG